LGGRLVSCHNTHTKPPLNNERPFAVDFINLFFFPLILPGLKRPCFHNRFSFNTPAVPVYHLQYTRQGIGLPQTATAKHRLPDSPVLQCPFMLLHSRLSSSMWWGWWLQTNSPSKWKQTPLGKKSGAYATPAFLHHHTKGVDMVSWPCCDFFALRQSRDRQFGCARASSSDMMSRFVHASRGVRMLVCVYETMPFQGLYVCCSCLLL